MLIPDEGDCSFLILHWMNCVCISFVSQETAIRLWLFSQKHFSHPCLQVPLLLPPLQSAADHVIWQLVPKTLNVNGLQVQETKSPQTTACTGKEQLASKHIQENIPDDVTGFEASNLAYKKTQLLILSFFFYFQEGDNYQWTNHFK